MNLKRVNQMLNFCGAAYILWHYMIKWCGILHFMFNFSSSFKRFFERIFKCFIHFLETLLWYWNHSLMKRPSSCHSCQFSFLPQWLGLALLKLHLSVLCIRLGEVSRLPVIFHLCQDYAFFLQSVFFCYWHSTFSWQDEWDRPWC